MDTNGSPQCTVCLIDVPVDIIQPVHVGANVACSIKGHKECLLQWWKYRCVCPFCLLPVYAYRSDDSTAITAIPSVDMSKHTRGPCVFCAKPLRLDDCVEQCTLCSRLYHKDKFCDLNLQWRESTVCLNCYVRYCMHPSSPEAIIELKPVVSPPPPRGSIVSSESGAEDAHAQRRVSPNYSQRWRRQMRAPESRAGILCRVSPASDAVALMWQRFSEMTINASTSSASHSTDGIRGGSIASPGRNLVVRRRIIRRRLRRPGSREVILRSNSV